MLQKNIFIIPEFWKMDVYAGCFVAGKIGGLGVSIDTHIMLASENAMIFHCRWGNYKCVRII